MQNIWLWLRWGGALLVAAVIALVIVPPQDDHLGDGAILGAELATFTVTDLDGRPVASTSWRGKVTVVNFWATWCGPCLVEIPAFLELQRAYPDDLEIVGLSMDDSSEAVRAFVKTHGVTYPIAMATSAAQDAFGGVIGLPTSYVLDPEGRVVAKHVGLVDMDVYRDAIAQHAPARGRPAR